MTATQGWRRLAAVAGCAWLALAAADARAGEMFKCGATFQDRPCEERDVQQRFSRTQGQFSIEQVNAGTDRDCAQVARDAMVWWQRMAAGETPERLHAEIQARNIAGQEKSLLRDVVNALRTYHGQPVEVRSQLESHCMAYKHRHGYPTERELASGGPDGEAATRRAEAEARRAEAEARSAAIRARISR